MTPQSSTTRRSLASALSATSSDRLIWLISWSSSPRKIFNTNELFGKELRFIFWINRSLIFEVPFAATLLKTPARDTFKAVVDLLTTSSGNYSTDEGIYLPKASFLFSFILCSLEVATNTAYRGGAVPFFKTPAHFHGVARGSLFPGTQCSPQNFLLSLTCF